FTFASTALLGSETRPRMRPPVPWANVSVEQIRHRLRTELNEMSQQDIRDGFDDGMGQILQISGANLFRSDSTCAQHKPCYNRARLGDSAALCQAEKCASRSATSRHIRKSCRATHKFISKSVT